MTFRRYLRTIVILIVKETSISQGTAHTGVNQVAGFLK